MRSAIRRILIPRAGVSRPRLSRLFLVVQIFAGKETRSTEFQAEYHLRLRIDRSEGRFAEKSPRPTGGEPFARCRRLLKQGRLEIIGR